MKRSLRIVVADDEADMRDYFQKSLKRLGHQVVAAAGNGQELIEQCRAQNPDLVITDIKMPQLDGIDAAQRIFHERAVPILLVSAFHDDALIERAEADHVMGYLVKPIKQADLETAVGLALRRFEEMQTLRQEVEKTVQAQNSPEDFKQFEFRSWETAAQQYDASFGRLTEQTAPRMLDVLQVAASVRFLDVACGPGYLTAQAAQRGATVLGVDFSPAMIDTARKRYPGLTFQVGDAEHLSDVADGSFDAAGMNFGILHLADPAQAIRELHRVLVPGGRVAFTVWCRPEAVAFPLVLGAIEKHGNPHVPMPSGPAFFQYSDPDLCRSILASCGFTANVETLPLTWKLTDADELFQAFYHGTARTGGLLRRQKPEDLARIRTALCEAVMAQGAAGNLLLPMPALLAWGVKS